MADKTPEELEAEREAEGRRTEVDVQVQTHEGEKPADEPSQD